MICFHYTRTLKASPSLQGPGHLEIHLPFPAPTTKKYTQDLNIVTQKYSTIQGFHKEKKKDQRAKNATIKSHINGVLQC